MKNFLNFFNKTKLQILDLLFPIECLNCGQEGVWLCHSCFKKLKLNDGQYCLNCKAKNKFGQFCPDCQADYFLNGVWIAGDYEDLILQKLIKNLKYHFAKNVSEALGNFLILFLKNLIKNSTIISSDIKSGFNWRKFKKIRKTPEALLNFKETLLIPVPLHKKRQRWRGFNQAEALANRLAAYFRLPLSSNKLIRIKHKKPQAKLGEALRKKNILDCYLWQGNNLAQKNIILIDDVTTTGSTLNECARILKQAGAREVWGLVVAKG